MKFVMSLLVASLMLVGTASVFAEGKDAKKPAAEKAVAANKVMGEITKVDATAKSVTVTLKGVDKVITYNDKTEIVKAGKPPVAGTADDLVVGARITARLDDSGVATRIEIMPAHKPHGDKKPAGDTAK